MICDICEIGTLHMAWQIDLNLLDRKFTWDVCRTLILYAFEETSYFIDQDWEQYKYNRDDLCYEFSSPLFVIVIIIIIIYAAANKR